MLTAQDDFDRQTDFHREEPIRSHIFWFSAALILTLTNIAYLLWSPSAQALEGNASWVIWGYFALMGCGCFAVGFAERRRWIRWRLERAKVERSISLGHQQLIDDVKCRRSS